MYILGVNAHHDGSACLLHNGEIVVAIEVERLNRVKHGEINFNNIWQCINYCLSAANIQWEDLSLVVCNSADAATVNRLRSWGEITFISHHIAHAYSVFAGSGFESAAVLITDGSGNQYKDVESHLKGSRIIPDHYEESESYYLIKEPFEVQVLQKNWGEWSEKMNTPPYYYRFPSLGHMYDLTSQYIFGHWAHPGKVMGLAPYGAADRLADIDIVIPNGDGSFTISTTWVDALPQKWSYGRGWQNEDAIALYKDIAYKVQSELEKALIHSANWLHAQTKERNLCIAGGVGLNCVANQKILHETPFEAIHIMPAAGDAGIAVGCAYFGYYKLQQRPSLPLKQLSHVYLGRAYAEDEIQQLLQAYTNNLLRVTWYQHGNSPVPMFVSYQTDEEPLKRERMIYDAVEKRYHLEIPFEYHKKLRWYFEAEDEQGVQVQKLTQTYGNSWELVPQPIIFDNPDFIETVTAQLLSKGLVIGWFQEGSEFGPRALGHRSILADPRNPNMRFHLNNIKGREQFRPVSPITTNEAALRFFKMTQLSPFMLLAPEVQEPYRAMIPSATHIDGTARVQTVSPETNKKVYKLLKAFEHLTEVPVLINTSFNGPGEPIVETPVDALCAFLRLRLDGLVLGNWIIGREQ